MIRKLTIALVIIITILIGIETTSFAFWIWTPKTKTFINPKFIVKDSPQEQYDWAMKFFKENDFKRSADEFVRLTQFYPDSDLAPDAQYFAGRSFEELSKYYFAFKSYQKTVDNYPYTKRMEDIVKREYDIANILQSEPGPKLMDLELSESLLRAVEIYEKIVSNMPFGSYADKSLYKMAECSRRMMKYDDAIDAYERIVNDYPESKLVPESKYQMAYTRYESSLDPEYDQASTEEALEEFEEISRTTAVPAIAKEAKKALVKLKSRKADSINKVAEFYEKRKKYMSAMIYYKEVVAKFSHTSAAMYAKERIEYLKKKIKD